MVAAATAAAAASGMASILSAHMGSSLVAAAAGKAAGSGVLLGPAWCASQMLQQSWHRLQGSQYQHQQRALSTSSNSVHSHGTQHSLIVSQHKRLTQAASSSPAAQQQLLLPGPAGPSAAGAAHAGSWQAQPWWLAGKQSMQQRQQQHRLQTTWRQYRTGGVPTDKGKAVQAQGEQEEKPGQQLDKDSIWTLPNMLSVGRAVSGPFIAYIILQENYSLALWATVISGLSDWADGAAARALGQNSALGSYLDPLADKVLVGCVVGALGWQGLVPGWLAGLVVGRDVALVAGMFLVRWRSLGWRVRGLTREEFFRVSPPSPTPASPAGPASEQSGRGEAAASPAAGGAQEGGLQQQQQQGAAAPGGVPPMRPLLISKANTVLQLGLVAGCLSQAYCSWPGQEALHVLEMATATTTAASFCAYAYNAATGKLKAGAS